MATLPNCKGSSSEELNREHPNNLKCSKCKIEQDISVFGNHNIICKSCIEEILGTRKTTTLFFCQFCLKYDLKLEDLKNSYTCKKCMKFTDRIYRKRQKEKCKESERRKYLKHKQKILESRKVYYNQNKEYINKRDHTQKMQRKKDDPAFHALLNARKRIRDIICNQVKIPNTELVGCSKEFIQEWFEFQFDAYMSWDNYGSYWHIDHHKPCALFDFDDKKQLLQCSHWSNLKPMEADENKTKKDDYTPEMEHLHNITIRAFTINRN
jgi:hypothetical protein